MAHTAWEKAKELVSQINIRKLTSNDLHLLNIRHLKLVAQAINVQEGLIISKPQFGKTPSNMKKAELINAIWHWRKTLMDCPQVPDKEWRDGRLSINVVTTSVQGALWTTSVGFDTEQEAYKFYQTACHKWWCRMACLREGKRTGFKWEVKLWDISPELYAQLQQGGSRGEASPLDTPPQGHTTEIVEEETMTEEQPLTADPAGGSLQERVAEGRIPPAISRLESGGDCGTCPDGTSGQQHAVAQVEEAEAPRVVRGVAGGSFPRATRLATPISNPIPTGNHPKLVEIYKPGTCYWFVDEATRQRLCAVCTKAELNFEIEKYLSLGCQVHCRDPKTSQIYLCKMVDGKIKYSPISIEAAVAEREKAASATPVQEKEVSRL